MCITGGPEYQSPSFLDSRDGVPSTIPAASHSEADSTAVRQSYPLSALEPVHGRELFRLSRALTPNVAMFLPRNVDVNEVAGLAPHETVEVEESWIGDGPHARLKACTAFFGVLCAAL
jgi:trimethylguanosine synthase